MATKHSPAIPGANGAMPAPPDGRITKEMLATRDKTYQHALEEGAYAFKQRVGSRLLTEMGMTAAANHSELMAELEAVREEPRGKWAKRHVEAFTEDLAKIDRHQQLGIVDAAGFKIAETIERAVAPDPKEPNRLEKWWKGK